jgi:two-component system, cell cycle sensor histidine kinase and response regulator CckA
MRPTLDFPFGCVEADPDGTVRYLNPEALRLLGYDGSQELAGKSIRDLLPLAGRVFVQTHVYPALALKGRIDEVYVALRAKSDERVPVLLNVARRRTDDGVVDHFAFTSVRRSRVYESELVHARRDAENALESERVTGERLHAVQERLASNERLAQVGTLAAGVAHEINNPLAYVSVNLDLLAESLSRTAETPPCELLTLVRDVQLGVTRIRDIVASLKKLSRVDEARRDPVDLGRVIEATVRIVGAELRGRAHLDVDLPPPAPIVLGDEGRLCQVALNLLMNAVQALPSERAATNVIRVAARAEGDRAILEVTDNGPGVPAEIARRIFDPFFTTKPVGEGTGLGLSVCHGIVSSLGGKLSFEDAPGGGARFRVELPLVARPAGEAGSPAPAPAPTATVAAVPPDESAPPAARAPRILVVDDDEPIRRVVARALRGLDVTCCESGKAALSRLSADGFDAFDVILCDLMMPEMSGMDLYAALAERAPETVSRMVFMTGGTFTESAQRFLAEIDNPSLPKPFTTKDLRRVCEAVMARLAATSTPAR